MKKILFLLGLVFICNEFKGQDIYTNQLSDYHTNIQNKVQVFFKDSSQSVTLYNHLFTDKNFNKEHFLQFTIINNKAIDDSMYLYMGQWIDFEGSISNRNKQESLPIVYKRVRTLIDSLPLGFIKIKANDTLQIIVKPKLRFFNINYVTPSLVHTNALNGFVYATYYEVHKPYVIFSLLFMGLMVAIFTYAMFSLAFQKSIEYLYYGLYCLFFLIYFGIRIYFLAKTDYTIVQHAIFTVHTIQIIGYVFYGLFIIEFLGLRKTKAFLYQSLILFTIISIVFVIADSFALYYYNSVEISSKMYVAVRYCLVALSATTFFVLVKAKYVMSKYIAWGVFCLCIFGFGSLLVTNTSTSFNKPYYNSFFDLRISLYQIGIALELVLFTIALQYKFVKKSQDSVKEIELLKLEKEKTEFENKMELLEIRDKERTRIAQEIHDDIGSGLTNIRLLSEIAINKASAHNNHEFELSKISTVASELVENMNEIIWAINSKNDTVRNLFAYIRSYAVNYFEDYEPIIVKVDISDVNANKEISGELRRTVFLLVKELMHNIIKHAKANEVFIQLLLLDDKTLNIVVKDNGIGFEQSNAASIRNGLRNINDRVHFFNGSIRFINHNGTLVQISLPINTTTK